MLPRYNKLITIGSFVKVIAAKAFWQQFLHRQVSNENICNKLYLNR
jgi:hypothetical protein